MRITSSSPVTLTVAFQDAAGQSIEPYRIEWKLFDENDEIVAQSVEELVAGDSEARIDIDGANNVIDGTRGARRFEARLVAQAGTVVSEQFYTIARTNVLGVLSNSFMTYAGALMLRDSLGQPMDGWDLADQNRRSAALETAFVKIARLSFKIYPLDPTIYASFEEDSDISGAINYDWIINDIRSMPIGQFNQMNPRFAESLRRAQIIEANNLLGGDVVESKRRDGIMSETIGESSMMFQSRPALRLPLCREAWSEIARWVYKAVMTVRG